ncbi:hypothetical protein [Bacillus sp. ISL-46]|uniref:hypothetical protein n=1 Tax=Bacillus sp. ISL-46 TaxID=2819129 RepID=UPI001BE8A204|nr:hypothetical protein [Bacillus sp. ISL-46]MBT2722889.1 hypothetical protein [Bacillus sp. ISL-46]
MHQTGFRDRNGRQKELNYARQQRKTVGTVTIGTLWCPSAVKKGRNGNHRSTMMPVSSEKKMER